MKIKLWVLILGIYLMGGTSVSAECKVVLTDDFQGKVCTDEVVRGGFKSSEELSYNGRWMINEDGGIFEGEKILSRSFFDAPYYSQKLRKKGNLTTSTFYGAVIYDESKEIDGKIAFSESLEGRELLTNGGIFEGKKILKRNLDCSQELTKEGNLTTYAFRGTVNYKESKDPNGRIIASQESLDGDWFVSPAVKLTGGMVIERLPNGEISLQDNRGIGDQMSRTR